MKHFFIFAFIFFTLNSSSQQCSIGVTDNTNSIPSVVLENLLIGFKLSSLEEETLTSINLIGADSGANVQMGLYTDNQGSPNNLIVETEVGIVANGLITLSVNPTVLPIGDYWVMAKYNSSAYHSYSADSETLYYFQALNFEDPIPATWTNSDTLINTTLNYSLIFDCEDPLSIDSFNNKNKITLYPNPSSDFIIVSNLEKQENFIVVNTLGHEVQKGTITSHYNKIDIKNLTNGLYFLIFDDANTIKFIKN